MTKARHPGFLSATAWIYTGDVRTEPADPSESHGQNSSCLSINSLRNNELQATTKIQVEEKVGSLNEAKVTGVWRDSWAHEETPIHP